MKKIKKALFFVLMSALVVAAAAAEVRSGVVRSTEEGLPQRNNNNLTTRVFLDITPYNGDDRADAFFDIRNTNRSMSLREFGRMMQPGDTVTFDSLAPFIGQDGRFTVIPATALIEHNGENIYLIFVDDLQDRTEGNLFGSAQQAHREALARRARGER